MLHASINKKIKVLTKRWSSNEKSICGFEKFFHNIHMSTTYTINEAITDMG
jgi:hypothetical protein